jgi:hypothetical protein
MTLPSWMVITGPSGTTNSVVAQAIDEKEASETTLATDRNSTRLISVILSATGLLEHMGRDPLRHQHHISNENVQKNSGKFVNRLSLKIKYTRQHSFVPTSKLLQFY